MPADAVRVLTPASGDTLGRAFQRLPAPFVLGNASVAPDHVTATVCTGPDRETCVGLRLDDPSRGCDGDAVGAWCVHYPGGAPPADLRAAVRAALAADPYDAVWTALPAEVPSTPALPRLENPLGARLPLALALASGMLLTGIVLIVATGRRRIAERSAPVRGEPPSPFAWLLAAACLVVTGLVTARLRFIEDDFVLLIAALDAPWQMDDSLRLFSSALLYGVGLRLGRGWFVAANLAAWLGSLATLHVLLRRAGRPRDEALVAVALAGLAPGYFQLVSSCIGFQTTLSIGLYYGIMLLVDLAGRTRADERARRAGFLAAALGATALGVFVKYPMMSIVPVLAWVWATRVVPAAPPPLSRRAFYLAFVIAVAVPLALTHRRSMEAGEMDKAGASAIAHNLGSLWRFLGPSLDRLAQGAAVLYLGIALQGPGPPAARWELMMAAAREDARRLFAFDHLRAVVLLGAVALAPFLFNARYFAPYYGAPMSAWIAVIAAIPLAAAARRLHGVGLVAAVVAVATLIPFGDLRRNLDERIANRPAAVLDAVRRVTAGLPTPCGVRLEARCDTPEATAAEGLQLGRLHDSTNSGAGVRWATGWHKVAVAIGGGEGKRGELPPSCAAPLTLGYCTGKGVWVAGGPR